MFDRFGPVAKTILTLALTSVLLFCILYFVFYTPLRSYVKLRDDIEFASERLNTNLSLISNYKQEKRELGRAQERLALLQALFSTNMQDGRALALFGLQAKKQNIVLNFFQPLPVMNKANYKQLPLQLGVRGAYSDVVQYLAWVEDVKNPLNLCEIIELKLEPHLPKSSEDQNDKHVEVTAKCSLILYINKTAVKELQFDEPVPVKVGRQNVFKKPLTGESTLLEATSRPAINNK